MRYLVYETSVGFDVATVDKIRPLHFLAQCHKMQLNWHLQLYICLSCGTFFFIFVFFVLNSQVIIFL